MKVSDILQTASENLFRSKLRTTLTIVAIFIGALTLTLTNGIGSGISSYIDRQINNLGTKDLLVIQAKNDNAANPTDTSPKKYNPDRVVSSIAGQTVSVLTDQDVAKIKSEPGIKDAVPNRAVNPDYITGPSDEKYQISAAAYVEGTNLDLESGSVADNTASTPQATIPSSYVSVLGFTGNDQAIGKKVTFGITSAQGEHVTIDATVVGVQRKSLIGDAAAEVNQALLTQMYSEQSKGLPANKTQQYLRVVAHYDTSLSDDQLSDLKKRLSSDGYTAQTVQDEIGIIQSIIKGIVMVFDLFGIIALLAASFGVINTLLMAVQERTKEIGLMKSMGLGGGKIFLLFSTEAVLLGFWGSLLGVLAAYGIGQIANRVATNTFLKDFDGLQLVTFPLKSVLAIMLLIMVITFLAGTLPARRAAKLNPIDALRYE